MNLKTIIAISLVSAVPECAQAQSPSAPKVTKDGAQVVTIISGDQAKTQTYCDIQNPGEQTERAYEKRNLKLGSGKSIRKTTSSPLRFRRYSKGSKGCTR